MFALNCCDSNTPNQISMQQFWEDKDYTNRWRKRVVTTQGWPRYSFISGVSPLFSERGSVYCLLRPRLPPGEDLSVVFKQDGLWKRVLKFNARVKIVRKLKRLWGFVAWAVSTFVTDASAKS